MTREEHAIILDSLPTGYAQSYKREPVAQALGESFFTLLELVPRENVSLMVKDRVYIGEAERDKIKYIKGRIGYEKLTSTAKSMLTSTVEELVKQQEERFVAFFNKAGAISVRQHTLELLPSIGKKHMWDIVEQREKKTFESYKDISSRVHLMPNPVRVIAERIELELKGENKYFLFVKPPKQDLPR